MSLFISTAVYAAEEMDYVRERKIMLDSQVIARGIKDPKILEAVGRIERHRFVPEGMRRYAYEDISLPLGEDEAVPPAYFVALVAQLADLKGGEKVLELGIEAGYQTAVLAELAKEVYCVEPSEELALQAEQRLKALGYKNIRVRTGSIESGWTEEAPFDVVVITSPVDYAPKLVVEQVITSGRIVMPIKEYWGKKLIVLTKRPKGKGYELAATLVMPIIGVEPEMMPGEEAGRQAEENKRWSPEEGSKWMKRR